MRTRIALAAASVAVSIAAGSVAGVAITPAAAIGDRPSGPAHVRPGHHQHRTGHPGPATTATTVSLVSWIPTAGALRPVDALTFHPKAIVAAPAPPPPPPPATDYTSVWTPDWQCIRIHESGDRFNSPSAPSGAYGIIQETWHSLGFSGWPYQAPASLQNFAALALFHRYGWGPWSSRFACGL